MDVNGRDLELIGALSGGLALQANPFAALGQSIGMDEAEVLARLQDLRDRGVIRRLGVIVRHHELGYRANAMVVWDIPDEKVSEIGKILGAAPEVTLCYRRPRRLPDWPYNLFTMIHGRDRLSVERALAAMAEREGVAHYPRHVLFSLRRFKQCGARYGRAMAAE
ncbi:Lrp/AsnC family transcriptional regulator [Magnetospirillum moscoviense]|uniref:siroheme decarboxylase n=1 Tax=Magnetospirillum moscoviense TaxID=1437059 RepID=A0A178N1C2_9PROT|nr:Lrp/AsnC family transcriptional regulator [Magnetospirillum moscoviense]MBF0324858.1 Lrp/AsnC family transcriptional regulator [Alphaproteobacteria bacterium]OAN63207.1 protein nirL [Magnetospirillum moscoviense]